MDKNLPRLTIKDIARLSGVGKSTVSRVINGDANVKQQTRDLVEQVILQQQFVPSKSARAMRGYSNKAIGIIVSRLDSVSENEAISAILPLFYQGGFDPVIVESQFERKKVIEHLKMFAQRQIDGLIIFAFTGLEPGLLDEWQNKAVVMARPYTGYQFAAELIKPYEKTLSTIVCATDTLALGVNKYLQENSITHIAVGSIGQSKLLHFLFPNTVSVHLGFHEAGILAAQTLLTLLKKSSPPTHTIVPSTLVINTLSKII